MARGAPAQAEMAGMGCTWGHLRGQKVVDEGYQRPATRPGLRHPRVLRRKRQAKTRKSATPKLVLSVEGRVQVLEGRSVSEIERLNLYFTQAAATPDPELVRWRGGAESAGAAFMGARALMRSRPLSWRGLVPIVALQEWAHPATQCMVSAECSRNFSCHQPCFFRAVRKALLVIVDWSLKRPQAAGSWDCTVAT